MKVKELIALLQEDNVDPEMEVFLDSKEYGDCTIYDGDVTLTYDGRVAIEC